MDSSSGWLHFSSTHFGTFFGVKVKRSSSSHPQKRKMAHLHRTIDSKCLELNSS